MSTRTVRITINGEVFEETVPIRMLLTDFIRERAGLTGTHVGCTYEGVCGACTVHLDGEAVKSCLMLAVQADGHAVTTVEGLAPNGQLSPLQKSFNENHALQCGYCTPGILMNMAEFIEKHPNPTDEEIRHALIGNLCRCTGYVHIVDAVREAAKQLRPPEARPSRATRTDISGSEQMDHPTDASPADGWFGAKFNRKEDQRLLTGRGRYIADIVVPGMLHLVFVRSQVAHARIKSIDTSKAKAMPGVVAVITGDDIKDQIAPLPQPVVVPNMPAKYPTHWPLAVGKVRFHGDALAAVVARDKYVAEDAAEAIEVDYEELPYVGDPEAALKPGAPIVHDGWDNNLIFEMTFTGGATPEDRRRTMPRCRRRSMPPTWSSASASAVIAAGSPRWRPAARSACGTTPTV